MEKIIMEGKVYTNSNKNCWFTEDFLKSYAEHVLKQPLTEELLNTWGLKLIKEE
jgi:hypothetical protein